MTWLTRRTFATLVLMAGACDGERILAAEPAEMMSAQARDVGDASRAILRQNCTRCHNPREHLGGLDLTSRAALLRGGDSGPVLDLAAPGESLLMRRAREGSMPPINDGDALSSAQVAQLAEWLELGVPWPAATEAFAPAGPEFDVPAHRFPRLRRMWSRRAARHQLYFRPFRP